MFSPASLCLSPYPKAPSFILTPCFLNGSVSNYFRQADYKLEMKVFIHLFFIFFYYFFFFAARRGPDWTCCLRKCSEKQRLH